MSPLLARLDARDRALFLRLVLTATSARSRRRFWTTLTHVGGARASIALSIASAALPGVTVAMAWRTLLLLGASHAVVQIVKRLVGRPRPTAWRGGDGPDPLVLVPDRFSFPSGHACAAMAVAVGLAVAMPSLTIPLLVVALFVGFSRVMLGVHYPGDVLVGQAIALIAAYPVLR
jgi:undecaprenyl-diphosphatase